MSVQRISINPDSTGEELWAAVDNGHKDAVLYLLSQGYLKQLDLHDVDVKHVLQVGACLPRPLGH